MLADINISEATAIIWAIAGAVIAIIGAVVTGVINIRSNQKSADKKLEEIHVLTNSNLSKINAALTTAMEKIVGLERRLEDRDLKITEQKVELAKLHTPGAALAPAIDPVPVVVIPDKPVPVTILEPKTSTK